MFVLTCWYLLVGGGRVSSRLRATQDSQRIRKFACRARLTGAYLLVILGGGAEHRDYIKRRIKRFHDSKRGPIT